MFSFVLISLLTFLNDYSVKTIPTRALPRSEVKQIKLVHFCCILLVFAQKHKDLLLGIGKGLFSLVRTPKSGGPKGCSVVPNLTQLKEVLYNVCVIKNRLCLCSVR